MSREVVWSNSARHEYLAITRCVAERDPAAAGRIADRIDEAAAALAEFATGRPGRVNGTYERVLKGLPYTLAYELVVRPEGGEVVAILHFIHTSRDWPPGRWQPGPSRG